MMDPGGAAVKLPNGGSAAAAGMVSKKHNHGQHAAAPPSAVYRECMKNHAASRGGYALDGCGEFILSPAAELSVPSSLTCAACCCHRNFHRRLLPPAPPTDHSTSSAEDHQLSPPHHLPRGNYPSPTAMLLALSHGAGGGAVAARQHHQQRQKMKRYRTKFTTEQKARMQELSEKLGWRMQKRDEAVIDECCRQIGVSRLVFKVWIHNNKHNFLPSSKSSRRSSKATDHLAHTAVDLASASVTEEAVNGGNNNGVIIRDQVNGGGSERTAEDDGDDHVVNIGSTNPKL